MAALNFGPQSPWNLGARPLPGMGGVAAPGQPSPQPGPQAPQQPRPSSGGFLNGVNPWQMGVTGSMNGQTVPFASEHVYTTPDAARMIAQRMGGNVVTQNMQGMSSPGSGPPSHPLQAIDFGSGEPVDAAALATWYKRGDTQAEIDARTRAGMHTVAWAGAPAASPAPGAWEGLSRSASSEQNPWAVAAKADAAKRRQVAPTYGPQGQSNDAASQLNGLNLSPNILSLIRALFGIG